MASIAFRVEPPVVMTSSTTTTVSPAWKLPSMRRPRPWSFGSLRTVNTWSFFSAPSRALVMPTAREMGSAPMVIPPMAATSGKRGRISSCTSFQPSAPTSVAPTGARAVMRQSTYRSDTLPEASVKVPVRTDFSRRMLFRRSYCSLMEIWMDEVVAPCITDTPGISNG